MKTTIPLAGLVSLVLLPLLFLTGCGGRKAVYTSAPPFVSAPVRQLNVYIENSGSMDGYMAPGSQLKDAVYSYVSNVDRLCDTTRLFYINSQIIPYAAGLQSFVRDLTPESFRNAGGNRANSDIAAMFAQMLRASGEGVVSIFVSDCILDIPDGDASLFFNRCQIDIRNIVADQTARQKGFSVAVVQLVSAFTGSYYYHGSSERLDGAKRPWYMVIMGGQHELAGLFEKYHPSQMGYGYKHMAAWAPDGQALFALASATGAQPVENGVQRELPLSEEASGIFTIKMRVNLSPMLQSERVLTDRANWTVSGAKGAKVVRVAAAQKDTLFTHVVTLSVPQGGAGSAITVKFKTPGVPEWVGQSNDDTGRNVRSHLGRTTGIKYILTGIAEAFGEKSNALTATFSLQ